MGGRPGRGWRRRCRRRSRRGGCRCRSCRRRHCLLLRPRRGASKRKRRRGARRTPQLDPSLQLQASAPPLPSQPRSQSPHAAGPEPRAHWPAAVAVRAGRPRKEPQLESYSHPKALDRPSPLPLPLGPLRRPEPIRRLPRPNPLSYWPLGSLGLPWREPRGIREFAAGSWDSAAGPRHPLSTTPELDHSRKAGLSSGRAWRRREAGSCGVGCDQGPREESWVSTWLITHWS